MAKQIQLPLEYPIPNNWKWVEMNKLISVQSGYPFDSNKFSTESEGRKPLVRIRDILRGETATFTDEDCPDDYIVHYGDMLIGMDGDFNIAKWHRGDALLNQRVCRIRSNSDALLNDYLFYFLPYPLKKINDVTPSVTVKHLSSNTIKQASIPLAPLAEQQRIVDRIESLFAKLDKAKEKAQSVVDGFEDRRAAILHKAFTGELTKQWRSSRKYDRAAWSHKRFSEICNIVRGGSPRPAGDPKYYDGTIPFLKVADITNNNGPYVTSATFSIKEAGLKKTRMVRANTLLLTNSGATLGVPAICTFQTTFNDGIAAFLDLDPDSLLFYYYFWTRKTPELRAINMGAAQPNLNTSIIGNVEVDIPTIEEQNEIVRILENTIKKEEQVKDAAEQIISQIDAMKKSILARAFRGELGTNDPADESAEELLKRLLH